jgi:hypothetical protein
MKGNLQKAGVRQNHFDFPGKNWSGRWDSNPRPQPWQGCALPLSYTRMTHRAVLLRSASMPELRQPRNGFEGSPRSTSSQGVEPAQSGSNSISVRSGPVSRCPPSRPCPHGFAFSPALISLTPRASARRAFAEPGRNGRCWLSWGAQPESQTRSKLARSRPSGSPKRSA